MAGVGCVTLGLPVPSPPGIDDLVGSVRIIGSAVTPIGEQEEIEIGRAIAATIAGRYGIVRDRQLTRYISTVGEAVAKKSDRPDLSYHFAVLDTDIINAFSCPGGYIFITRGTLATIGSEAELASVLAHEISHVAKKHIIKEIEKQKFLNVGNDVAGDLLHTDPAIFNAVTSFGTNVVFKGLSRSDEYQADRLALGYVAKAGYDPNSLLTFLNMLRSRAGSPNAEGVKLLFATHPRIDDRIKEVTAAIGKMPEEERGGKVLVERYVEHVGPTSSVR